MGGTKRTKTIGGGSPSQAFILAHVCLLAVVLCIAVQYDESLFFWHPSLMSLFLFLQVEAVLAMKGCLPFLARRQKDRVEAHFWLQMLAIAAAVVGFFAIYQNKENGGKMHFLTNHSWYGLGALGATTAACIFGYLLDEKKMLQRMFGTKRLRTLSMCHRYFGAVTVMLVGATVVTAFWLSPTSGWSIRKLGTPLRVGLSVFVVIGVAVGLFWPGVPKPLKFRLKN